MVFVDKLSTKIKGASSALEHGKADKAKALLKEGKDVLDEQREHTRIADRFGWDVLVSYRQTDVVVGEDKRKRLDRARNDIQRASLQRGLMPTAYFRPQREQSYNAACFRCGLPGHMAKDCRAAMPSSARDRQQDWQNTSNSRGGSLSQFSPHLTGGNAIMPAGHQLNPSRAASNSDVPLVEDKSYFFPCHPLEHVIKVSDLSEFAIHEEEIGQPLGVRGRLRRHISFWKKIGASQFVLSVRSNGYYLPFVSPPPPHYADNHECS